MSVKQEPSLIRAHEQVPICLKKAKKRPLRNLEG